MSQSLRESLRAAVLDERRDKSDARFEFGTEYTQNFGRPPAEYYEVWRPFPLDATAGTLHSQEKHLISKSAIFPRLNSDPEVVRGKLLPKITELAAACKDLDVQGRGYLSQDELSAALKATGVFLSHADVKEALLPMIPRNPTGHIDYNALLDVLLGKERVATTTGGAITGRPPLPDKIEWADGESFTVNLRLRSTHQPFTFEPERMQKYARYATQLCKEEVDAEQVHSRLRTFMMHDLVVEPGRPGHPDLAFREWLAANSVMSLTMRAGAPGPVPPEVYDVLDQVIYEALGLPKVMPPVQVLTALGASMRHMHN